MKFLVTGGSGYIGSHMVKYLLGKKHSVTIYDNLSSGRLKYNSNVKFVKVDLVNLKLLEKLMYKSQFEAVFHFAGLSIVEESEKKKQKYYLNNVVATKNLINTMIKNNINNLIFSSSASVYGKPLNSKITEIHRMKPISQYGKNKMEIEKLLSEKGKTNNFKSISFRYFNAAGADDTADIGEDHKPETHLIPRILNSIKNNKTVYVYGKNYKTKDGTCIRDYIHVNDIVRAHYLGLKQFKKRKCFKNYNIGSGKGYSVLEILNNIEKITKKKLKIIFKSKRPGDPPILVANCNKINRELKWRPKYNDINKILSTAWKWHKKK